MPLPTNRLYQPRHAEPEQEDADDALEEMNGNTCEPWPGEIGGEGDEQISLSLAHTLYNAVGSKEKKLRVFSREEGGFHHCQVDNITIGVHTMWDWVCDVLKPGR